MIDWFDWLTIYDYHSIQHTLLWITVRKNIGSFKNTFTFTDSTEYVAQINVVCSITCYEALLLWSLWRRPVCSITCYVWGAVAMVAMEAISVFITCYEVLAVAMVAVEAIGEFHHLLWGAVVWSLWRRSASSITCYEMLLLRSLWRRSGLFMLMYLAPQSHVGT